MAKSEGIMGGSAGISPRKAMASGMGEGSGKFGVKSYSDVQRPTKTHPDKTAKTGGKMMADNGRGIGGPVARGKGGHPAQSAPDHGPTHPGGHGMKAYGKRV